MCDKKLKVSLFLKSKKTETKAKKEKACRVTNNRFSNSKTQKDGINKDSKLKGLNQQNHNLNN